MPLILYSFLPFARGIIPNLLRLCPFESKMLPHTTCELLVSHDSPKSSTMCLLLHDCSPLPRVQPRLTLLHPPLITALMTQIHCSSFSTFFNLHRRKLPVFDRFLTEAIVAEVNGSSWLAKSTRHKSKLLCFFQTDCQHLTVVILNFFWFYSNHLPSRAFISALSASSINFPKFFFNCSLFAI